MKAIRIHKPLKIADENTRNVVVNIINSFGVKALSMIIILFTTPAYMHYFSNAEELGIWFTIISVLVWILNFDFGIGNGLRNKLVEALVARDTEKVKKYISSAYFFLIIMSCIVFLAILLVSKLISWNFVFNIPASVLDAGTLNKAMVVLLSSILFQFVFQLINSILYSLQKSFVPSLLNFLTNLLMLLFVLVSNAIHHNNDIVQLAFAYMISVNVPLFITTVIVFNTYLKSAVPSIRYCRRSYAFQILKVGGAFLWLQLMSLLLNNTNSYLISIFIGNAPVVEFQIYSRIFVLFGTFMSLITAPIWSAVTKVQAENNYVWMKKLYDKLIYIAIGAIIAEFLLMIPLQLIFNIWLQDKSIQVNYFYAAIFATSGSLMIWSSIITCFSNGLCELRIQTIFLTVGAILNIPMAYLFARLTNSYISIVVANICSILPYCVAQTFWLDRYFHKNIIKYNSR